MKYDYNELTAAIEEAQGLHRWYITFQAENGTAGDIVSKLEGVAIRATSSGLPAPNVEHMTLQIQGRNIKYVGKVDKSGQINLTLAEGTDTKSMDAINFWLSQYWSALKGTSKTTKELKVKVVMSLLDGADQETMVSTLRGVLPGMNPGGSLGQDVSPMQPQLTLDYDEYEYKGKEIT